jgi:quinol monooxygenase YgiN
MITYITHMRVRAENAVPFEAAMEEMTGKVHEHEPGVVFYGTFKKDDDPETYMVIEIYRDEVAFKDHWKTDFIRPILARTKPLVEDEAFDIKRYLTP